MNCFARRLTVFALVCFALGATGLVQLYQWTAPQPLNTDAVSEDFEDEYGHIVTGGNGTWIATWARTDTDFESPTGSGIMASRSVDAGVTWSTPTQLTWNPDTVHSEGDSGPPRAATDNQGHWIVVWTSRDSLGNTIGTDADIVFVRSMDDGLTWSGPAALDPNAASTDCWNDDPDIATNGSGTWIVVWHTCDYDELVYSRSTDNGVTWTNPSEVDDALYFANGDNHDACIAAASDGTWLIAWTSSDTLNDTIDRDNDILFSRSTNDGLTWSAASPLNSNAYTDGGEYGLEGDDGGTFEGPCLVTDGAGIWVAAWFSDNDLGGSIDDDTDILFARSADNGLTWSTPQPLNSYAAIDSDFSDDDGWWGPPQLATDGYGSWMAVWQLEGDLNGQFPDPRNIMFAYSTDDALTWSAAAPVDTTETGGWSYYPSIAADPSGDWLCVWRGRYFSPGADHEILVSYMQLGGPGHPADVNHDKTVDAVDVQLVINEALGISTEYGCDIDGDHAVNAVDVQLVINGALGL